MKSVILLFLTLFLLFSCNLDLLEKHSAPGKATEIQADRAVARITNGLVGEWNFDSRSILTSTTPDSSGKGNTGLVVGAALTNGWLGNSLKFDGGDGVVVGDDPSINFGTGDFSFVCYFKADETGGIKTILDKRDATRGYHVCLYGSQFLIQITDGTNWANFLSGTTYITIRPHQWYSIVITVDRDNTSGLKMFIDGYRTATHNPTGIQGSLSNSASLLIGAHKDMSGAGFTGSIDHFKLYNRALSETEARTVMAPGIPPYEPTLWNSGAVYPKNNCYNYAANVRTDTIAQPGAANGYNLRNYFDYYSSGYFYDSAKTTAEKIEYLKQAVLADGLEPIEGDDWFHLTNYKGIVALMFTEDFYEADDIYDSDDYHFFRLNSDNTTWSHKRGTAAIAVQVHDFSGNIIFEPAYCDRGPYTYFIGYYRVWSDSVQGAGHEYIR